MTCTILAHYLDDCFEWKESVELLRELAEGAAGTPACLRVTAKSAQLVGRDLVVDELPGTASYLWVLWSGSPPTLDAMVALHGEHLRAADEGGACAP